MAKTDPIEEAEDELLLLLLLLLTMPLLPLILEVDDWGGAVAGLAISPNALVIDIDILFRLAIPSKSLPALEAEDKVIRGLLLLKVSSFKVQPLLR